MKRNGAEVLVSTSSIHKLPYKATGPTTATISTHQSASQMPTLSDLSNF